MVLHYQPYNEEINNSTQTPSEDKEMMDISRLVYPTITQILNHINQKKFSFEFHLRQKILK